MTIHHDDTALAFAAMVHADAALRAAEVAGVVALLEAAGLHTLDEDPSLPPHLRIKRVPSGRDGVLGPTEAFVLEAGAALGLGFSAMKERTSQAMSVRLRHPRMWEVFVAGALPWWVARQVEEASRELSFEAALEVDRRASHWLGMHSPWTVLCELPTWVAEADAERAARRVSWAEEERFVHVGRFEDDHCGVFARVAAADGVLLDQALDQIAATLPAPDIPEHIDERDRARFVRGQRRAAAFGIFARQAIGQDSLMDVEMVVHVPARALSPEELAADARAANDAIPLGTVAEVEGWGRLLTSSLPSFLAGSKVTVRPVLDPHLVPDAAAHEPTAAQRLALQVRNPRSVFPFSTIGARHSDVDHTVAFGPTGAEGPTTMSNLGPLDRRAHRMKTAGHWLLRQPEPGVYLWTSPYGFQYLVTGQGTVQTRAPVLPVPPLPALEPPPPPEFEPPPDPWAELPPDE